MSVGWIVSGTILAAIVFLVWIIRRERKAGRSSAHAKNVEESLKVQRKKEQELQELDRAYDDEVVKYLSNRSFTRKPWWRMYDKDDS